MTKHITPAIVATFAALGFTPVDASKVMTFDDAEPLADADTPAIFYHVGIDTYAAYAPEVVDGMYDGQLEGLRAIAVVDNDVSAANITHFRDVPLEVIAVGDLAEFVAQRAFSPKFFDLRIAKQCVAHAKQALSDLEGDDCADPDEFDLCSKNVLDAAMHLRAMPVAYFRPAAMI
ncbi:hypothetical protein [Rugamonas aquatica]|uniref:Uncharacterized protein n=1 Tax=Rugamonas aquatica TaxID=2743357 RepID=A0A6A7N3S3_9BURK|nr:hypothetical protein [Rugamonas aquatica]MQA39627.1 hypothetical protein [Rugamonas aquatica]